MLRVVVTDFEVAGMTTPGVPVVQAGRNPHVSWGLTTANVDNVDLFIEKIDMNNPNTYYFDGQKREMG